METLICKQLLAAQDLCCLLSYSFLKLPDIKMSNCKFKHTCYVKLGNEMLKEANGTRKAKCGADVIEKAPHVAGIRVVDKHVLRYLFKAKHDNGHLLM